MFVASLSFSSAPVFSFFRSPVYSVFRFSTNSVVGFVVCFKLRDGDRREKGGVRWDVVDPFSASRITPHQFQA